MAEGKAWAERYRGFGGASRAFQRASKHAGDRQGIMRVGVPLVELNRFQCCLGSLSQIGYAIAAPTIGNERSADAAEPKMRFRQLRVELDRLSEQLSSARLLMIVLGREGPEVCFWHIASVGAVQRYVWSWG